MHSAILLATVGCIDNGTIPPNMTIVAEGLNNPTGLAIRSDGTVLIAESGAGRIVLVDENGDAATWVAGFAVGSFFPYDIGPLSVAIVADGSVAVGEGGESEGRERISFYNDAGVENPEAALVPVSGSNFNGLAIHPTTGDLYVASSESDRIFRFPAIEGGGFGVEQVFVEDTTVPPLWRKAPSGLAFEADGMLLVAFADVAASGIVRLTTAPEAETTLADVLYESDLTVTSVATAPDNGEIFFTEANYSANQLGQGRVARLIERDGKQVAETFIQDLTAPASLAFGPAGALYITTLGATPNANAGTVLRAERDTASTPAGIDDAANAAPISAVPEPG